MTTPVKLEENPDDDSHNNNNANSGDGGNTTATGGEVITDVVDNIVVPVEFDVLSDDYGGIYVLDDYNNGQIGNNRLKVLIEMNHESFSLSFNQNDQKECEKVVRQIHSVTRQKGRFLSKPIHHGSNSSGDGNNNNNADNGWKVLNEDQSLELVRQALRSPLPEREIGQPADDSFEPLALTKASNISVSAAAAATAAAEAVAGEFFEPLPLGDNAVDFDLGDLGSLDIGNLGLDERPGPLDPGPGLSPPSSTAADLSSSDKKRGRRRSLLRRSVSESNFDKKKTYRNLSGEVGLSEFSGLQPLPPNMRRFHSNADRTSTPAPPPLARGLHRAATVSSERNLGSYMYNNSTYGADTNVPNFGGGVSTPIPEFSPLPVSSNGGQPSSQNPNNGQMMNSFQSQKYGNQTNNINPTSSTKDSMIVAQYSGMDVVLRNDCRSLSPKKDIVGNNRLSVMISLHKSGFNTKSPIEQTKVASDLVETVQVHWNARILVDTGFAYNQLVYADAVNAMKILLSDQSPSSAMSSSLISSATSTGTSMSLLSSTSSNSSAVTSTTTTGSQHLLASAPPVPDFLRNASMEILNGGHGSSQQETGPEQMQSAAIRSLQVRKARRDMNKAKGGQKKKEGSSSSLSPTPSQSEKDPPERTASSSSSK